MLNQRRPITSRLLTLCSGFTLTELLVVISVIAILVSITLPAIKIIRTSAREMRCANNLRQIFVATKAYASDCDDMIVTCDTGSPQYDNWITLLHSWNPEWNGGGQDTDIGKGVVASCPYIIDHPLEFRNSGSSANNSGYGLRSQRFRGGLFQYNKDVAAPWYFSQFDNPSQQSFIADSDWRTLELWNWNRGEWRPYPAGPGSQSEYWYPRRHRGGMNMVFFDGHISRVPEPLTAKTFNDYLNYTP